MRITTLNNVVAHIRVTQPETVVVQITGAQAYANQAVAAAQVAQVAADRLPDPAGQQAQRRLVADGDGGWMFDDPGGSGGSGAFADQDTIVGTGSFSDPFSAPDMLRISQRLAEFDTADAKTEARENLGLNVIDGGSFV